MVALRALTPLKDTSVPDRFLHSALSFSAEPRKLFQSILEWVNALKMHFILTENTTAKKENTKHFRINKKAQPWKYKTETTVSDKLLN